MKEKIAIISRTLWLSVIAICLGSSVIWADPLNQPMSFSSHVPCGGNACSPYILAKGQITADTPAKLKAFLAKVEYKPKICFLSYGGDLAAAVEMGYIIRKARLDTCLNGPYEQMINAYKSTTLAEKGMCFSACAYAFLGGVVREIGADGPLEEDGLYGVHRFAGRGSDLGEEPTQVMTSLLANYISDMGVDRKLLDYASLTGKTKMQIIPLSVARELNIDNTRPPKLPWQLMADKNGQLIMYVKQRQAFRDAELIFAIHKEGAVHYGTLIYKINQGYRSVSALDSAFSDCRDIDFWFNNKTNYNISLTSGWKRDTNNEYSAIFIIPQGVLRQITQVAEFRLAAGMPNALRDIRPDVDFGTSGFISALRALSKQ